MQYWQESQAEVKQRLLNWIGKQITELLMDMEYMPSRKVTCYMRGKADAYDMARCMILNTEKIETVNATLNVYLQRAKTYAEDYDGTPRIMRIMYRGKMAAFQAVMDWLKPYQVEEQPTETNHV